MTDPLVLALAERAKSDGLGVRALARKLGLSPAMISRAFGGAEVGAKFIGRAIHAYPDLAPLAAESLKRLDGTVSEIEQQPATVAAS
jgi:hypothetical protein